MAKELMGDSAASWSLIAEGRFWSGLATGMSATRSVMTDRNREVKVKGAKARDEKFEPLRQLTKTLAEANNYRSKRDAAKRIKPEVLKLAESTGVRMSESQAEITIQGWLTAFGISFARKHSTSSSKDDTSTS